MKFFLIVCAALLVTGLEHTGANLILAELVQEPLRAARHDATTTREYRFVEAHLDAPFNGYGTLDTLAPQFRVIALSNMAMGMMNVVSETPTLRARILPRVHEIRRRALSANVSPFHKPFHHSDRLDDHNLYYSHLALILGIERIIRCGEECTGKDDHDAMLTRLVTHLRSRSLATRTFHARSYPDSPRWPADQLVTLVAIRVYDASHHTHLLDAPLAGYLRVMREHTDTETGLFQSAITPLPYSRIPRGCAISYSIPLLAQVAPDVARDQYRAYTRHMTASVLGLGGFREWPPGRELNADADSGPIVFGMGVAATGFGLGAARIMDDEQEVRAIGRTVISIGIPSPNPRGGYLMSPLLGEAILFNGRTARIWFPESRAVALNRP